MARVCSRDVDIHPLPALITAQNRGRSIQAKYLPHASQALAADTRLDGMAEAAEQNVVPRILGVVPAQLSHSSTKLEDSHDAEIVGEN